jgi:hypothetical protein
VCEKEKERPRKNVVVHMLGQKGGTCLYALLQAGLRISIRCKTVLLQKRKRRGEEEGKR